MTARWGGWLATAGVHVGVLVAFIGLAGQAPPRAAAPRTIEARLLPMSLPVVATAHAVAPPTPRAMTDLPSVPVLPVPEVQLLQAAAATSSPTVPSQPAAPVAPLVFDPPAASAQASTEASDRRPDVMASTLMPAAAAAQPVADQAAALPPGHRQCSELQTARHYPAMLRDRGIQGQVMVRVKVDEDGRAADVMVANGSGWRLLDEAARRVALACPYLPARRGDQRLASWVEYAVRFAIQPAALQ